MTENDGLTAQLAELQEFLAVAPDDEEDFAGWRDAVGEALSLLSSRSASIVALKAKVRQLDDYVTDEFGEWAQAAADAADIRRRYESLSAVAREVAAEREGHELGGKSPLYVKLCSLDEALAALSSPVSPEQEQQP